MKKILIITIIFLLQSYESFGSVDSKGIPQVIEMTLINPKKFRIKKQKTTRNYPIKGLDYRNYKRGPEIQISFKN